MFKNAWFQIHWFVGITAGVVLALVGLTGGILSFETELQDWLNQDVRTVVPVGSQRLSPASLVDSARREFPDKRIASITLSGDPSGAARITFAPPPREGGASRGSPGPRGESRYFDPYTGALIEGDGTRGQAFFRNVRSLHRWLMAGGLGNQDIGRQIVGAATALCLVLALSGLYLRWPRKSWSLRAWFTFDTALKGRNFLWHLHSVLGTWVLIGLLLMSLTGLYWSYEWYRNGLYSLAGVERPAPREGRGSDGGADSPRGDASGRRASGTADFPAAGLQAVWSAFVRESAASGFSTATVTLPQRPGRPVEIRYLDADPAHPRANNTMSIDAASAEIVSHERYDDKRAGEKFMSSIFPLHSGSFFGIGGVVAYMLASLAMPVFTITGWMLYLDRRKRRKAVRAALQATSRGRVSSVSNAAHPEPYADP